MALRVLLADESTSIKKVMQLALQDFGVEVKAVPVGTDVLAVARSWTPDIIFVDVLLAKKSGYEVSAEIKADKQLAKLPVVLIWSSFMDIDEKKAVACGATRRLEKPFDAETLRGIIKDLVPVTGGNAISSYLSFPKLPDFVEKRATAAKAPPPPPAAKIPESTVPDINDIDEPEDFSQVPLPKVSTPSSENWTQGNLDRFKINLPKDDFSGFDDKIENLDSAPISVANANHQSQEIHLGDLDSATNLKNEPAEPGTPQINLDPEMAERLVREHVRSVLQDIAWKIIPDMTERIVREEIQKLLKDAEKL